VMCEPGHSTRLSLGRPTRPPFLFVGGNVPSVPGFPSRISLRDLLVKSLIYGAHEALCVACKQQIPSGSSLCSVCKSYQRSWKNHVQYFAGIATLLALTISALVWVVEKGRSAFFSHENVVLVACNTLDTGAVIVNRGDKEVFISHLMLSMAGRDNRPWGAPVLTIDERLEPGQFLRRAFPTARVNSGTFVKGLSADDFEKLMIKASTGDPCTEAAFFSTSDGMLANV